nr:MAG TPA: tail protein [Caudoviricetes sp.]
MLIKTKYIDCASKSVFNTWKLPTSAADTSGDIYWSAIVYIQDTGEVWTHGKLYGGFFSNADSNKVSLTIGGTTKILALDGHVQSYTTLTGSGTTADQAILSTGVANKWTLKTLGKNAFSNVDYLPADATAVAAEKVVNAMRFQYNGKDMHSFDGSVARLLNIIQGDNVFITGDSQGNVTIAADPGSDTVNTAGATNLINKKLFLIGAESQTTSPQTYSNQYVYIGTDNCLYSLGKKVLTEHQAIYNLDLQTQVGDAVTKVTTFDPNAANNSFTLVQGTNVTLLPDATNKKVTISSKDTTYDFYNLAFKQGDAVIDTYKPTTAPNKAFRAGTNVTFTKSGDEVIVTTQDTRNTAGATEKLATKLFLTGSLTQTDNPQTYTNSKVYIGTDNKLYSDGKVVSTGDHTHNYAGATSPGGPALKVDLNPSGLLAATYGSYGGILQDSNNGPVAGSWSNRIKILHNNTSGYYTELAQAFTGTAGLWHRRNVAGVVSDWTPVIDKANFRTYLDATYVIRGNDPNVLTNYVRYSIASGLTMNWEWGNATPTHIWGAKASDSSKAYVFNGDNIRAFANAVNRAGDTMTGTLKVTEIQATNGNGLVMWNGTTYTYLGMQAGTTYIRSGETDLQHRYNGTDYKIWDARNLVGLRTEHSHNTINFIDSRETASTPQEHAAGVWLDFKANAKANLSDGGNYTGLLTVRKYGGTTDWSGGKSAQLGFTDNSNVWVRFGTGTSWEAWKQLATTGWADGKFLPLAGGKMTSGARISHDGNLYIGNSDNAGWVALQDICSQNSIGDGVWSIRTNGNAIFTTIKKVGSSDSYVLLGGGGHKALNQFIYSTYGSYGVNERTGNSDDLGRAGFWRDNNLGAYGVTLMHSDSANYQCKIYHDYGTGGNLYMKSRADGTWGNIYTIWNSGNFDPNTKVNKAGDTMTGNLKMTETTNIILRFANTGYTSGIGYDTSGNECIALWAKNTITRLRWYAGKDMSNMVAGSMMGITPDFEVSKASGSAVGYIGGSTIWHSGNSNLTSVAWNAKEITFGSTNFPKDGAPRANISPYSIKVWDSYGQVVAGSSNYGVVLEVMGRGGHWDNQLYFEAYGHNIWHRASSYNDSSWSYTWEKLAVQSDLSKYLPLSGGTMSSGARISHNGHLYIGHPSNSGWVGVQDICSQSSLGDKYWSIRINGTAVFKGVTGSGFTKTGSSDNYVLLGGGGHRALSDLGGTHTHSQYVAKTGDTMTGALKVMNILLQNNDEINCETNTLFLQYRGSKGIRLCNNNQPLTYGSSNYTIYHTGNLSLDNYVKKTGDTMTGNLQVGQVVIGNTNEVNATDSGNVLYLGYRNTPGGVNICYNNAPLTYGSAKYTIYHSGNISSVLNKRRVPGEVVDFYVYQVNGYTCTSTDYTTFRNQLFDSSGRGKSSVSYKATSSSMTYTVNLSDFVLAHNGISAYSNGMYTAGGGEIESNRIGRTAGANSKTITGYEMPKHAHWFGHYRSDNANDRDVFGPDGGQNHSTNGTTSAGRGGNWRTGYSGNGQSKDWRPKTIFVFKMVYAPQSW